MFFNNKKNQIKLKETLLNFIIMVVLFTSFSNIVGWPSLIKEHWENTIFGDKFFPFDTNLSVTNRRILAGMLELMAAFLMIRPKTRKYGTGIIMVMYGRGAMIHMEIARSWKYVIVGFCASIAGLLFIQELMAASLFRAFADDYPYVDDAEDFTATTPVKQGKAVHTK